MEIFSFSTIDCRDLSDHAEKIGLHLSCAFLDVDGCFYSVPIYRLFTGDVVLWFKSIQHVSSFLSRYRSFHNVKFWSRKALTPLYQLNVVFDSIDLSFYEKVSDN